MPCATGVHWVLGHFPSVVKFVWLLLIKCLRRSSVKCDAQFYTCSNMHCSCIHTPITWRGLSLSFVADYIRTYEQFGTREFVSMYKHSWTHADKMGQEKIQCKAYTLISFTTSTPGMRHDTQYWGNKKSCCLNAMCNWSPLGFRTLSKCPQVCLTLMKCMWKSIYNLTHNSNTCSNMHCSCIHTPITWRGLSLSFVADYIRTYEQFGTREFASMYKHGWTQADTWRQEKIQCKAYVLLGLDKLYITPFMTLYLVISLPKILYIHRM